MSAEDVKQARAGDEPSFRRLIQSVADYAIYMIDAGGIVRTWNPGAERFKGYTEAEILGQHFSRFYTEEDRRTGLPARALATATGEGRFEQEGWRVRKDGTRMWAHVIIDPIRDDDGTLIGFAKITRDITERKKAQDELRRSEERFRMLVMGVRDYAIYMLDPLGHVTNWNPGAERFKGYTADEIVGRHFSEFYTEEDRATGLPARALETAVREGRFVHEGWRVRKDGARFWADVVIDPIRDEDGTLVGFAKITRDVTERRNAQLALEEARARFVQAQKMETIGQLTGGIAHDFNNLLAVVLGNLELAGKRLPDDPRLRQLVENSIEAAKRGAALTQRMLAFARRQELKTEPVDVPELIRNMAEILQRTIGPDIQINTQFPLRLRRAMADGNQLELAVLNLVVNARDAMPDGGTITISAREMRLDADEKDGLPAGDYVRLSVVDTGEGMDPETLARAVEPFFTTKGVGKGTGLGLSMVHGFADQSAGRLILESDKGKGTTAALWLPVAVEAAEVAPAPAPISPRPRRTTRRLQVLVVDDDPLVLMNTAAMLEDLGHEVTEATSGEQARRIVRRGHGIDLVITDQLMPGMTGTQLVAAVRAERRELPFILATGYSDPATRGDLAVWRLNKPFAQDDLANAIAAATGADAQVLPFRSK